MKKILGSFIVLLSVLLVLTSCSKFTCDLCGDEKIGKKHETEFMGRDIVICDDCYDELEEMEDDLEEGFEDLKDLFK